jgi:hypothetical protein
MQVVCIDSNIVLAARNANAKCHDDVTATFNTIAGLVRRYGAASGPVVAPREVARESRTADVVPDTEQCGDERGCWVKQGCGERHREAAVLETDLEGRRPHAVRRHAERAPHAVARSETDTIV